jgi:hypothetical protein
VTGWDCKDYKTVASPIIDVIDKENFKYLFSTPTLRGGERRGVEGACCSFGLSNLG